MQTRNRRPELMDDPALEEVRHLEALRGLARVNRLSRTVDVLWRAIRAAADCSGELRVVDLACGGGETLVGLAGRAKRDGYALSGVGYDISPTAIRYANDNLGKLQGHYRVQFRQADCLAAPLPDCDFALCSLFLHHLSEADAVLLMRRMRSAARIVLIDDLIRSRAGYLLAWAGTRLLTRSRIVHVDGPLSVGGAFSLSEVRALAEQAGMQDVTISRHWPFRFLLQWSSS